MRYDLKRISYKQIDPFMPNSYNYVLGSCRIRGSYYKLPALLGIWCDQALLPYMTTAPPLTFALAPCMLENEPLSWSKQTHEGVSSQE